MKYNKKVILLLVMLITFFTMGFSNSKGNVYVIPIEGEINKATYNFVKNTMDDIDIESTDAIIFDIDTYGGLIDQAINIKDLIINSPIPTISYVNNKAVSAGVLITIASDNVVMSNSATVGSAETDPNTEKTLSMWRGVLRDTAQASGRDSLVIESMADKDIEIDGVIESGKLLNLTSREALDMKISDATAETYAEILKAFKLEDSSIVNVNESLSVKLAKYIASPYMASFLLTIGFVGMVIEILTPGFGIGGTISIIGFGLYFGGNIIAGNSNWTSLVLFVTGLSLLVVAIIVPGFGLPEIGSLVFISTGVILALDSVTTAVLSLSIAIIITTLITMLLLKLGYNSKHLNKIILKSNHTSDKGYLSTNKMDKYLNREGISKSELRPSGFVLIDNIKLDVLAESGFIEKNTKVKVIRVEGSKIFVRRI